MKTPEGIRLTLSSSAIKEFIRSPEHFIQYRLEGSKDTMAYAFGNAYHTYVLQQELFFTKYIILDENKRPVPDKNYQTKANREWKEEFWAQAVADKMDVVTTAEFEVIQEMYKKLKSRPDAWELIDYTRAKFEQEINWKRKGIQFKGFLDINADVFFADLKTTKNAEPGQFQRDIWNYRYDIQGACYSDARANGKMRFGKHDPFYIIAQEKDAPYGVSVHLLSNEVLDKALEEVFQACDSFNQCVKDNFWPGYEIKAPALIGGEINHDGVFPIFRPSWIK